jgi:hypothetical protein
MRRLPARIALALMILLAAAPAGAAGIEPPRPGEDTEPPPERLSKKELLDYADTRVEQAPRGEVFTEALTSAGSLTWLPLGPKPILGDYWASGNAAGRVSSVVVDPRNGNVAYIAAAQGGVWKTTDGGTTWTALTDGLSSLSSGALALDPVNPDIVYYGTGEMHQSSDSFVGDGLFRSANGGALWTKIATKANLGAYVSRLAVNPSATNILYAGTNLGFMVSIDGGATWTATKTGGWCFDFAFDPTNPAIVYAAMEANGIYKSTDSGNNWVKLTTGLPVSGFDRINLAIAPSNTQVLYASFVQPSGVLAGMFKTVNGGTN